ncbi:hypothetical protein B0H13DRAFT_1614860, partial [Mycena leptocephala]
QNLHEYYKDKVHFPLDLHSKKTRVIRRRLSKLSGTTGRMAHILIGSSQHDASLKTPLSIYQRTRRSHPLFPEPELFRGYNPKKKAFNQEIELIHDLEPIEVAESEAHKFKLQHGNKCDIWAGEGGQWFFKLKKGALVFVPKSFSFSRTVTGQIPTGWHAGRHQDWFVHVQGEAGVGDSHGYRQCRHHLG